MKKSLFFLFLLITALYASAQISQEQLEALVSRDKISTGVLYNRVVPFAGLHSFGKNGKQDMSSYQHFLQAYYELYLY